MAEQPESFLFLRLSALGDVVFALEALAALKARLPGARVDWVVEDRCAALVEGHPQVERVVVYPRARLRGTAGKPWRWPGAAAALAGHLRALRARQYDVALDLQGNAKSAAHLLLCRAREKLAHGPPLSREGAWRAAKRVVAAPDPPPHRAEVGLLLLRALGIEAEPAPVVLPPAPQDAVAFWGAVPGRGPRVALVPGSSAFGAFKRWPAARYRELGAALVEAVDARVAVLAGPGEEALAGEVRRGREDRLALLAGRDLPSLAAVLGRADLVVGGDTGPLHLAAAAGAPVLALFGPKDPARYGPRGPQARVLRNPVPCSPCTLRACPAPLCVLGVHTREVAEQALAMLRGR